MQKAIVCDITDDFLKCTNADSDRFIYSNYYLPLQVTFADEVTPILPFYIKSLIQEIFTYGVLDVRRVLPTLQNLGLGDLFTKNQFDPTSAGGASISLTGSGNPAERRSTGAVDLSPLTTNLKDAGELFKLLASKVDVKDQGLFGVAERKLDEARAVAERASTSAEQATGGGINPEVAHITNMIGPLASDQEIEFFLGLLQSVIGFAFLDRTRIRPAGFVIGEHIYALGLAPGEEITIEQKTYSKKQLTYEEQNETEKQLDLELSSTLSTELQEGFERQKSLSDSWGLSLSHTGQYTSPTGPWGTFNASHTIGFTKNVTDASQETSRRSVRDSQTASSKVAAKYRTLHKTDFKLSTEQGFEQSSKRVIKNPNRSTPITLHYFKILQKLRLSQERYGVRLCWRPCVRNPAFSFLQQIADGKKQILDKARASLPAEPQQPQPTPPAAANQMPTETKTFWSDIFACDKWGLTGDMRADYDLDIVYDSGYMWDGDLNAVSSNLKLITQRTQAAANVVGMPYATQSDKGNILRVKVHVGTPSWIGGPGISIQDGANFTKEQPISNTTAQDSQYADALAAYRTALQDWNDKVAQIMDQAQKDADAWEQVMLQQLNPVNELVKCIVQTEFPPAVRNEYWEIDLWQKVFEWERAGYVPYPSWWSDLPMHDPTKDPVDFLNASWACLYLPIRAGMERIALRWIYGKTVGKSLSPDIETVFDTIENDLKQYRTDTFGDPTESPVLSSECVDIPDKFYCLGKWTDLMPTDGTHIEIIQSYTSGADDFSTSEIQDASDLRKAVLDSRKQDSKLKSKAVDQMTEAAQTKVKIEPDDQQQGS